MEDSWTLARAIEYARLTSPSASIAETVAEALYIFDTVRKPYYEAMYACPRSSSKLLRLLPPSTQGLSFVILTICARFQFRESQKAVLKEVGRKDYDDFDSELRRRFSSDGLGARRGKNFLGFVYQSDIGKTWREFVENDNARRGGNGK